MNPALHSSAKHDWETPDVVLELVRDFSDVGISLDPCTSADNPTGAAVFYTEGGLEREWNEYPGCYNDDDLLLVYVNPPYGRELPRWVDKCIDEALPGTPRQIILLVPARPDTAWYDRAEQSANALCEWRGRLRFKGAPSCAPFPSALFYWGPQPYLFCHVFQPHGRVRVLRERP